MVAPEPDKVATLAAVAIREYEAERDREAAEAVERMCEVGPNGGAMSLFTDLLGDPLCRVRHSPPFLMLVAELNRGPQSVIVGLVRGCIKTVACGTNQPHLLPCPAKHHTALNPIYTKVAYLLGLRVSPAHRRQGIALKLVERMEEWFKEKGAEYAYMATEKDNEASLRLFTGRCGYSKFRTPAILAHPVLAHRLPLPPRIAVLRLPAADAETLYRSRFAATEFFPRDIDAVLANPLSLGTFLAVLANPLSLRRGIPHWGSLACAEDVWCVKRIAEEYGDGTLGDWSKAPPAPSILVDPREF